MTYVHVRIDFSYLWLLIGERHQRRFLQQDNSFLSQSVDSWPLIGRVNGDFQALDGRLVCLQILQACRRVFESLDRDILDCFGLVAMWDGIFMHQQLRTIVGLLLQACVATSGSQR